MRGGLYAEYISAFGVGPSSAPAHPRPGAQQLQHLAAVVAEASATLSASQSDSLAVQPDSVSGSAREPPLELLQQRVVLGRMAARVSAELMRALAEAAVQGAQAEVAPPVVHSMLALCGVDGGLRPAAVGAATWHVGGALLQGALVA